MNLFNYNIIFMVFNNIMKFNQNQKAKFIASFIKTGGFLGFLSISGYLLYRYSISENQGRENALLYEEKQGKTQKK